MVVGEHGVRTDPAQRHVVEESKNDQENATIPNQCMVELNALEKTENWLIAPLTDVQSTVNGHHGEASVNALFLAEVVTKKDIDLALLLLHDMVADTVLVILDT